MIRCRNKRGCFAKSSPRPRTDVNENAYDMEPVASSSSTRATSYPDAAAVVQYDALWNASGPQINLPPQHPAASHADGSDPARDSTDEAQRQDSGTTMVDNTLYEASNPRPNTKL